MNTDDKTDRKTLKSYFKKNSRPTENNFAELIDGMINQKDDGLVKLRDKPLSIEAVGNESTVIHFYQNFDGTNPDWILNLNSRSDKDDSNSAKLGFHIRDGDGKSRLFIDRNTGNVGIGKIDPEVKLEVSGAIKASGITISDGGTRQLFVADNGKVGIGTTNSQVELKVQGDTQINASLKVSSDVTVGKVEGQRFIFHSRSNQGGDFLHMTSDQKDGSWEWNKGIVFVRGTGNIGIGTGSGSAIKTLDTLLTIGNGTNQDLLKFNTERSWKFTASGSGSNTSLDLQSLGPNKSFRVLSQKGKVIFEVRADDNKGEVKADGVAVRSSREYKENIVGLNSEQAMMLMQSLNPVMYTYKGDNKQELQLGFIAEDVPDFIATPDHKGIRPMSILAVLCGVVHEQQATIVGLQDEMKSLTECLRGG